jgi:pimeloyl-ACP methyl ester carboxylesterase
MMEKVISKDGTPIAYHRQGSGPPLILVHGAGSNAKRWFHIIPHLEENFTVFALERRGRGESGDHQSYAFEREIEDILAVVDLNDQPVNLFGHSFGAFLTLEAALLTGKLNKLMLYEPPIPLPGSKVLPDGLMDDYERLINQKKNEEALIMFYSRVGISPQEIELMQATPEWHERVASAHTILRESRFAEQYTYNQERYIALQVQTLLMVGSESPPWAKASTETLNHTLPNSSILELPGLKHAAMVTAPDLFVDALTRFFKD